MSKTNEIHEVLEELFGGPSTPHHRIEAAIAGGLLTPEECRELNPYPEMYAAHVVYRHHARAFDDASETSIKPEMPRVFKLVRFS